MAPNQSLFHSIAHTNIHWAFCRSLPMKKMLFLKLLKSKASILLQEQPFTSWRALTSASDKPEATYFFPASLFISARNAWEKSVSYQVPTCKFCGNPGVLGLVLYRFPKFITKGPIFLENWATWLTHWRPLTPGAFSQKCVLWPFGGFPAGSRPN